MEQIASESLRSANRPLLSIDPGPIQSGWCILQDGAVTNCGVSDNSDMLASVYLWHGQLAIECVQSFGMAVGKEVFDTCIWIGRLIQAYKYPELVHRVYRKDVKLHLCGSPRAKDANVRQALIDLYGGKEAAIGRKSSPGPLHGVKSHAWSALAVAVTAAHQMKEAV